MAEAFGVAVSVAQLVSFGVSTAQNLYSVSQGASRAEKSISNLADHVKANTRILENLKKLFGDNESKLSDELVEDIKIVVKNYQNALQEISDALGDATGNLKDSERQPKVNLSHKIKWPILHEPLAKALRQQLGECSVTLNLILTIYWGRSGTKEHSGNPHPHETSPLEVRKAVADVLREGFEHARHSSVPSIANAIEASSNRNNNTASREGLHNSPPTTTPCLQSSHSRFCNECDVREVQRSGSIDGANAQTLKRGAPVSTDPKPWLLDRPNVGLQTLPAIPKNLDEGVGMPDNKSPPVPENTAKHESVGRDESMLANRRLSDVDPGYTMWAVTPSEGKFWSRDWRRPQFHEVPVSKAFIQGFISRKDSKNPAHLLETLSTLASPISSAVRHHARRLELNLVAIEIHRKKLLLKALSLGQVASLDLVTQPNLRPGPKKLPPKHQNFDWEAPNSFAVVPASTDNMELDSQRSRVNSDVRLSHTDDSFACAPGPFNRHRRAKSSNVTLDSSNVTLHLSPFRCIEEKATQMSSLVDEESSTRPSTTQAVPPAPRFELDSSENELRGPLTVVPAMQTSYDPTIGDEWHASKPTADPAQPVDYELLADKLIRELGSRWRPDRDLGRRDP